MNDKPVILAVDDTTESMALLVKILTTAGYQVRPADSGELALAAVAASPPDLILLDIRMKGMDGLEVCRQLKAQEDSGHIPVIFLSSATEIEDRIKGLKLGAADYIAKPFEVEELLTRVKTHLALGRANSSLKQQAAELRLINEQLQSEIVKRQRVEDELLQNLAELRQAMAEIKSLKGLIPICAGCKKIRDDKGFWTQVETYIVRHSDAHFTHGLCPNCVKNYFPTLKEDGSIDSPKGTP